MTDKDNEQSKYRRTDQKSDNRPVITHKLHNIKKRRVTRQHYSRLLDVMHSFKQHLLVFKFYILLTSQLRVPVEHWLFFNVILSSLIAFSLNCASTTILSYVFKIRLNNHSEFSGFFFPSKVKFNVYSPADSIQDRRMLRCPGLMENTCT